MYECNDYSDVLEDFSINSMYKVLKLSIWEDMWGKRNLKYDIIKTILTFWNSKKWKQICSGQKDI